MGKREDEREKGIKTLIVTGTENRAKREGVERKERRN